MVIYTQPGNLEPIFLLVRGVMSLGFFTALTQFRFYFPYHLGILHCIVGVRSDTLTLVLLPHFYTGYTVNSAYFLKIVFPILPVKFVIVYATQSSSRIAQRWLRTVFACFHMYVLSHGIDEILCPCG